MDGWEQFRRTRGPSGSEPTARINKSGSITLNPSAYALIDNPAAVLVFYNPKKKAFKLQGVPRDSADSFTVRVSGKSYVIGARKVFDFFRIENDTPSTYRAQKGEDGLLLTKDRE